MHHPRQGEKQHSSLHQKRGVDSGASRTTPNGGVREKSVTLPAGMHIPVDVYQGSNEEESAPDHSISLQRALQHNHTHDECRWEDFFSAKSTTIPANTKTMAPYWRSVREWPNIITCNSDPHTTVRKVQILSSKKRRRKSKT